MSWTLHNEYLPSTAFGACFKCRGARRPGERILDPNLVTDDLPPELVTGHHDGHIMICESCITEAASLLGMLSPLQVANQIAEHAGLIAEHEKLTETVAAQAEALAALRRLDAHPRGEQLRSTGDISVNSAPAARVTTKTSSR